MQPFKDVTIHPESVVVMESSTPLLASTSVTCNPSLIDVCDVMLTENTSPVTVAATRYQMNPTAGVPEFFLDYYIFAERDDGLCAFGTLEIRTMIGDSVNGGDTPIAADQGNAYSVHYAGPAAEWLQLTTTTIDALKDKPHTGTIRIQGRTIRVVYINGSRAQDRFSLGVYLRGMGK